jgi:hypothetical protein
MSRLFSFIARLSRRAAASRGDGIALRAMKLRTVELRALELRALERHCLEQARLCRLPESRAALEEIARNYREAINRFALSAAWPG